MTNLKYWIACVFAQSMGTYYDINISISIQNKNVLQVHQYYNVNAQLNLKWLLNLDSPEKTFFFSLSKLYYVW